MRAYVFTGPTLAAQDAASELDAIFLPPVAQGDVDRLVRPGTTAIGIIDGFFELVPAVWHKEILFAMSEGIHVFGAASMGALRAAELEPFGMEGVGEIFRAFRDGTLTDDDEVAVMHTVAQDGYVPVSEAMVNVRSTVAAARQDGVVGPAAAAGVVSAAKQNFYADRIWPVILRDARRLVPSFKEEFDRLAAWLPKGRIDQKRDDAIAMLRRMRLFLDAAPPRKHVKFRLEHTDLWEEGRYRRGDEVGVQIDHLLEEVSLDGDTWRTYAMAVLARVLATDEARRRGYQPPPSVIHDIVRDLSLRHGLRTGGAFWAWLAAQSLDEAELRRLAADDARLQWVSKLVVDDVLAGLPAELKRAGVHEPYAARAADKAELLAKFGLDNPGVVDTGLDETELLGWWFDLRGEPWPPDLAAYAEARGFPDLAAFRTALTREWLYRHVTRDGSLPPGKTNRN